MALAAALALTVAPGASARAAELQPSPIEVPPAEPPPVDAEAMREAMSANGPGSPMGSAAAYLHYLEGNLAAGRGDHAAAVESYRQALALDEAATHARLRLAEEFRALGLTDRGEAEAKLATQADPGSSEAHRTFGQLLLQAGRFGVAAHEFERAVTLDPRDPRAHRGLVEARQGLRDGRGMERALDNWARGAPGEPLGWREFGEQWLTRGDVLRAERYLRRALAFRPEDPQALAALGRLAERRGETDLSTALFERSLRADPEAPAVLFALGQRHLVRAGEPAAAKGAGKANPGAPAAAPELAAARAYFDSLIAVADDEAAVRAEVALAYLQNHREAEALRELDAAVAAAPENGRWHYYRGVVELQLRRFADASADLQAILPADENYVDARSKLGLCLFKLDRPLEAVEALQQGLSERPYATRLAVVLAEIQRASGQGAEAVAQLERAVAPGYPSDLVEALADAYEAVGRRQDALGLLRQVIHRRPADGHLRFLLGAKLRRAGDFDAAVATMRELLRLDPRNAEALNFIGYEYAQRGMRLPEAERLVTQAAALEPSNGQVADSLGWIYYKEGRLKLAIETLKRAARLAPDEPAIAEHLGDVYAAQGEIRLALERYGQALDLLDRNPDAEVAESVRRKLQGMKARTASAAK